MYLEIYQHIPKCIFSKVFMNNTFDYKEKKNDVNNKKLISDDENYSNLCNRTNCMPLMIINGLQSMIKYLTY